MGKGGGGSYMYVRTVEYTKSLQEMPSNIS